MRGEAEAWRRWAQDFGDDMRASMGAMFVSRVGSTAVVKGSPYSADVITERNQRLEGGNVITHGTHGHVYRDGSGRVRQETERHDGKPGTVFIDDAEAGMRYMLLPGRKHPIAIRDPAHTRPGTHHSESLSLDGTEVKVEDGRAFVNGKPVDPGSVHVKSASGKEVRIERGRIYVDGRPAAPAAPTGQNVTVVSRAGDDGLTREVVRVEVIRPDDDIPLAPPPPPAPAIPPLPPTVPGELEAPIAPLPPMPGMNTLRFESTAGLGRGVTRSLGTKEMAGLRCDGRSTVWTIPAGQIGNAKPIAITSESWYSPDLQVTVYSRYDDPRTGESIYRLANVKRGEPPAELFKPPKER
ncbi:MAG TPA: hypothetical protein VHQ02_08975 [Usitatibacter sp.]|nr:hypothetical protein [Usitatibacter sp.]